jgi:cytochrome c554/c'-like protein
MGLLQNPISYPLMMANRDWWIVGLLALAVGLATTRLRSTGQTPAPASPRQSDAPVIASQPSNAYLGVNSCASVACHGGPMSSPSTWQSSYTVWVTKDRHAKAYSVLWEPRSKDIVRLLNGVGNPQSPQPWNDARCLACHSLHSATADLRIVSDGVSCEACHGAASKWLVPHTTAGWGKLTKHEKYAARFGMQNTKEMIPRAEACIGCHVGQSDSKDGSPRDVTHGLIAAGHPRLAFEFSAYMANMPPHWNAAAAHATKREASAWVVGQALTAQAASELRAAHAARGSMEFADYDCYACHHELQSESWRRTQSEAPRDHRSAPGELRLSTWYTGMFQRVQPLSKLNLKAATAMEAAQALNTWINGQDADGLRQIMAGIATQGADAVHWDDATQCYLALLALDNARRDDPKSRDSGPSEKGKRIRDSIKLLNQELTFPKALNSPRNYDPKQFQTEMRNLADLLTGKNK